MLAFMFNTVFKQWAVASVAWPHKSISISGVNQRARGSGYPAVLAWVLLLDSNLVT